MVVTRTLSKTWSMAAARLGYLIGPAWLVDELDTVTLPYHLDAMKQLAGTLALAWRAEMEARVAAVVAERRRLVAVLDRLAVERVGLYVPSAGAPLISTVLMTAVPAKVAGVATTALCSAPGPDGRVPAGILAAAALSGVDEVYRVGGVQAIAALAYGTCLLYTSPSPRDRTRSRMPSSA